MGEQYRRSKSGKTSPKLFAHQERNLWLPNRPSYSLNLPFDKLAITSFPTLSTLKLHRIGFNNSIDIPSMNDKFNLYNTKIYMPS